MIEILETDTHWSIKFEWEKGTMKRLIKTIWAWFKKHFAVNFNIRCWAIPIGFDITGGKTVFIDILCISIMITFE